MPALHNYTEYLRELSVEETELPKEILDNIEVHKRLDRAVKAQNIKDKIVASNEQLINDICEYAYNKGVQELKHDDVDTSKELKTEVTQHIAKKKRYGGVGIWAFID